MARVTGMLVALAVCSCQHAPTAELTPHVFRRGEVLTYDYDDTDIAYCAELADGIPVAKTPLWLRELKLTTATVIDGATRHLRVLPESGYRETHGDALQGAFVPLPAIAYNYSSETYALSHVSELLGAELTWDEVGQFVFFKLQDVHQMQASAEGLRADLAPGGSYSTQPHNTDGLGGAFAGGPAHYHYVATERLGDTAVATIRVTAPGNVFTTASVTAYTSFTYEMRIALDGPHRGLLVDGGGQETVYPRGIGDASCPIVLQRQFSLRLR